MDTLLCVLGFPFALCLESGNQESVRCTRNVDIAVSLNEMERLFVVVKREFGKRFQGWRKFWEVSIFFILLGFGVGCGRS